MNTFKQIGLVLALALSSSITANAAVLYNNLPADASQVDNGLGISGSGFFGANKFSTSTLCPLGCTLGNITLNLTSLDSSTASYQLKVVSDSAGVPGAALVTLDNPDTFSTTADNNIFTTPILFKLSAATNYWVEFSSINNNGLAYWDYINTPVQSVPNQPKQIAFNVGQGFQTQTAPTFLMKVEALPIGQTAVPIPGTIWMMVSALIGVAASWRSRSGNL